MNTKIIPWPKNGDGSYRLCNDHYNRSDEYPNIHASYFRQLREFIKVWGTKSDSNTGYYVSRN